MSFYLRFDTERDTGFACWSGWNRVWWAGGNRGNAYIFTTAEGARAAMADVAAQIKDVPPNCWQVHALVDGDQTEPWDFEAERPAADAKR